MTVRSRWVLAQALVTVVLLGLYAHLIVASLVGLVFWLREPRLSSRTSEAT